MEISFRIKAFLPAILLCAAFLLPAPTSAYAQSDQFSQLMTEGIRLYREGSSDPSKYERAIEAFLKAQRIDPIPDIVYNIARSYHMLGNCPSALSHYREYEVEAKKVGGGKDVSEYINTLALQCGQSMGTITLRCTPVDTTVSIDSERPVACTGTHRVKSGERRLVFVAPNQNSSSRMITVSTNSNIDLDIDLSQGSNAQATHYPAAATQQPPPTAMPGQHRRSTGYSQDVAPLPPPQDVAPPMPALKDRKLFWAGIGTSSGGALFTIIGGIVLANSHKLFENWCIKDKNGNDVCRDIHERKTGAYGTGIAFTTIGSIAVAAGITMLIVDAVKSDNALKKHRITPMANFDADSASFGLNMTF